MSVPLSCEIKGLLLTNYDFILAGMTTGLYIRTAASLVPRFH